MSACISRHGEFSSHQPDDAYTCKLCGVLDEHGLIAELRQLRADLAEAREAIAEVARRAGQYRDWLLQNDPQDRHGRAEVWDSARKLAEEYAPPVPTPSEPHSDHHVYLSTYCYHGLHDQCGAAQHARGDLTKPHCKNCPAPCTCPRHTNPATPCTGGDRQRVHDPSCALDDSHLGWCGPIPAESESEPWPLSVACPTCTAGERQWCGSDVIDGRVRGVVGAVHDARRAAAAEEADRV